MLGPSTTAGATCGSVQAASAQLLLLRPVPGVVQVLICTGLFLVAPVCAEATGFSEGVFVEPIITTLPAFSGFHIDYKLLVVKTWIRLLIDRSQQRLYRWDHRGLELNPA